MFLCETQNHMGKFNYLIYQTKNWTVHFNLLPCKMGNLFQPYVACS